MNIEIIVFILFITICTCTILDNFIADYYKYKHVELLTVFTCWKNKNLINLNKVLNSFQLRSSFIYINTFIDNNYFNLSLNHSEYDTYGYMLDLSCENSQEFLEMDANLDRWKTRYHNHYKWLIMSPELYNVSDIINIFENVKLRIDSDVTIVQYSRGNISLLDIYNPGYGIMHGNVSIKEKLFYNIDLRKFISLEMSFYEERKDMTGLTIRTSTVITKNISKPVQEYLVDRSNIYDSVNKLNYALFLHIIGIHGFTNVLLTTKTWYGSTPMGTDAGIVQHFWTGQSEVSATSGIMSRERVLSLDYLISTYYFGTCFIFRNPSAIGKIRNQFFDPFAFNTWCVCLLFCILICVVLKITFNTQIRFGLISEEQGSWSSSVLNTLAALCQQDIEVDAENITGRILILTLMVLSLLLYNYYTSSIVSDLINSRTQAFTTINELVHSNLDLGMEEIAYTLRLFKITDDPDLKYLRDKKILRTGSTSKFFTPKYGIERVKQGGFAYHVEPATGYPLIAKSFDGDEICDLCEIYVFQPTLIYVIAPKRSQYRELFLISYRKMMERGIMNREKLIWQSQKPQCLSSANVLQIELEQVAPAFFVLLFGILTALTILFVEIKRKTNNKK